MKLCRTPEGIGNSHRLPLRQQLKRHRRYAHRIFAIMAYRYALRPLMRSRRYQLAKPQRCFSTTIQRTESRSQSTSQERTTHFGFETVPESEKEARGNYYFIVGPRNYLAYIFIVAGVFSNVATSYDTMNDCMSLGIHRLWK